MFCKIIFVLATAYVINASVTSDNVFDDEISENTFSDLEDLVTLKDEITDPGAVSESNVEDSVPSRACNNNRCNQLCRKKKFRGGACVGANCYCHKFLSLLEDTMNDLEESISLDDNFLTTEDVVSDESLPVSELTENQTKRGCNMQACGQLCRRLKLRGGACVNGRCKCDHFFGTEDPVDEYSEFAPRRVCRLKKCNRTCTLRGYEDATCLNGRCKCYNKTQVQEDQTERRCNMQACDEFCRGLKFSGGACVNGHCKCDHFFGTEVDAVDEYSELATRRVCNLRQCNRTCTRRGYKTARCVNGWCKCYNKIQRQDASPLNDVSSDESEESNKIFLRTTEEELIVPSPSACNTVTCNQMCHRLNYAGGWCRLGQCQCY